MIGRRKLLAPLCVAWLCLAGAAPPCLEVAALEVPAELAGGGSEAPVEPGEQYPPSHQEEAVRPTVAAPPAAPRPASRAADFRLSVDMSVTADSNVTNGTRLSAIPIDFGDGPLPVPVDPNLREKAGMGAGVSAAANLRLPISAEAALAVDVEGYAVEYQGPRSDDASALVAAGLEFGPGNAPTGALQLIAFDRWYGGVEALQGVGVRGNWRRPLSPTSNLRLAVDVRIFDSGYGDAFGGSSASLYLTYDSVLNPSLSFSGGIYARREWLGDDAFSSLDAGAYGGLSAFLSEDFSGGVTAGLSRTVFDEPILLLDPDRRADWRVYASGWLTTRRPVALGLHPSLTYTYSRTSSSIPYFSSDRHRLRLGVRRQF
ncbi:MAG TPA: surface lipoprotein assembly modifier [Allosphingosinicella sp.]|nr:surface lipoprotein assembly modifier [Allosphingosinicella sp.]